MTFGIFVSYDTPYFAQVAEFTMPVLARYCARHGYSLQIQQNPPVVRNLVWDRALTMLENIKKFDWTVHFDADILVTNHSIRLEDIVDKFPRYGGLFMIRDHTGLNDGIVITAQCERSMVLWRSLWKMESEVSSLSATWKYVSENPAQTVIRELPQKLLHSYPYHEYGIDYPEGTWEPGDFSYHLPGMTNARRVELLNSMLPRIQW